MLSSRLLERMKTRISPDKCRSIEQYIDSLSYSSRLTVERASQHLSMDYDLTEDALKTLVDMDELQSILYLRCPECRILIEPIDDATDISEGVYCHSCGEDVDIDESDIDEIFLLVPNSEDISEKFPDSYSLLAVDKVYDYGISQGKLLHVAGSIEELNEFALANGVNNKLLHYVVGDNLL